MKNIKNLVQYKIEIMPEMDAPDGHFSMQEDVDMVNNQMAEGNEWAWCTVVVTAYIDGVDVVGTDSLGACSYGNQAAFEACDYFADMKSEALRDLKAGLKELTTNLRKAGIV